MLDGRQAPLIVLAPDSFKGSLDAREYAAIAQQLADHRRDQLLGVGEHDLHDALRGALR